VEKIEIIIEENTALIYHIKKIIDMQAEKNNEQTNKRKQISFSLSSSTLREFFSRDKASILQLHFKVEISFFFGIGIDDFFFGIEYFDSKSRVNFFFKTILEKRLI
jgi:hypothetical protein